MVSPPPTDHIKSASLLKAFSISSARFKGVLLPMIPSSNQMFSPSIILKFCFFKKSIDFIKRSLYGKEAAPKLGATK